MPKRSRRSASRPPASRPRAPRPGPAASAPARVRVSGPEQLLVSLPYLIDVALERSVVVVGLARERSGREVIAFELRVDLDPLANGSADPGEVAALAAPHCPDGAIVAIYAGSDADDPQAEGPPHAELGARLAEALRDEEVEVRDCLAVRGQRWWSLLCDDPWCCPPEGRLLPGPGDTAVPAGLVVQGLAPGRPRAELAAEVAGPAALRLTAMCQALGRVSDELMAGLASGGLDAAGWRDETVRLLRDARDGVAAGGGLDCAESARLLVGLGDVRVRDQAMGWIGDDGPAHWEPLWRALVRAAPDEWAAPPATLLAWALYRSGGGALATLALERALRADPGYGLAVLLGHALTNGVSPGGLDEAIRLGAQAAADSRWGEPATDQAGCG